MPRDTLDDGERYTPMTGSGIGLSGTKNIYGSGTLISNWVEDIAKTAHRRRRSVLDYGAPFQAETTSKGHFKRPELNKEEMANDARSRATLKATMRGQPGATIFHHTLREDEPQTHFMSTSNVAYSEPRKGKIPIDQGLWGPSKRHNSRVPVRPEQVTQY
ncbi:unnamed protein product [Pedinophyceae sp. YPF-701]|nr:unnamed protein product [Pedinophyceae sp. YPF-701]